MRDFAIVTKIEGKIIEAIPLSSNACMNCQDYFCARQGKPFTVINKKSLNLQENDIVKIGFSNLSRGIQGLLSFLVPILVAVLAYIFAPEFSGKINIELSENFRMLFILSSFLISSATVIIIGRSNIHFSLPEVLMVL